MFEINDNGTLSPITRIIAMKTEPILYVSFVIKFDIHVLGFLLTIAVIKATIVSSELFGQDLVINHVTVWGPKKNNIIYKTCNNFQILLLVKMVT